MPIDLLSENTNQPVDLLESKGSDLINQPTEKYQESTGSLLGKGVTTTAALAVAPVLGAGVYKSGKWLIQPALDLADTNKESAKIKKELRLPDKFRNEDLPSQIKLQKPLSIDPLKKAQYDHAIITKQAINNASNQLAQFDKAILTTNVDEAAQLIKIGHQGFLNSGYKNYGTALDAGALLLKEAGVEGLSGLEYTQKVIEPAIKYAKASFNDEHLSILESIKQKLAPVADSSGIYEPEKIISLQQAKKFIDEIPDLRLKHNLTDNFGQLLQDVAPEGTKVKQIIAEANKSYKPFAEMNKATASFIKKGTGEFDDAGVERFLSSYIKTAQDTSKDNILNLMSKGNANVNPIEGLSQKVENLRDLRKVRGQLTSAKTDITNSSLSKSLELKNKLAIEMKKWTNLEVKAGELASRTKGAKGALMGRAVALGSIAGTGAISALARMVGKVNAKIPLVQSAFQAATAFETWKLRNEPLQQFSKVMDAATFGLDPMGDMPSKNKIDQIRKDAESNTDYSNSIMTPETYNFLKFRNKNIDEQRSKGKWSKTPEELAIGRLKKSRFSRKSGD